MWVEGKRIRSTSPIRFDGASVAAAELERVATFLRSHPELGQIAVVMNGSASPLWSERYESVVDVLVRLGVDRERVSMSADYAPDAPDVAFEVLGLPEVAKLQPCGWWAPTRHTSEPVSVDPSGLLVLDEPIVFGHKKRKMDPASHSILDAVAEFLIANPKFWRVRIEGHVSWHAVTSHSPAKRRAENVAKHLLEKGVARKRLVVRDFGSSKPIASHKTEAGRKKNDRVEIYVETLPAYLAALCDEHRRR